EDSLPAPGAGAAGTVGSNGFSLALGAATGAALALLFAAPSLPLAFSAKRGSDGGSSRGGGGAAMVIALIAASATRTTERSSPLTSPVATGATASTVAVAAIPRCRPEI